MKPADRHDTGKPQLHYNDTFPVADEGTARVSEYGATKYAPYNYMKGAKGSIESYNCARRHMSKWLNGIDYDMEASQRGFQLHHIDLAIWNLKRLRQELEDFPERDDRPHKVLERETLVSVEEPVPEDAWELTERGGIYAWDDLVCVDIVTPPGRHKPDCPVLETWLKEQGL